MLFGEAKIQKVCAVGFCAHEKRRGVRAFFKLSVSEDLALTRLIAGVLLVDDINAAFALDDFAIRIALFKGLERVRYFHGLVPVFNPLTARRPVFLYRGQTKAKDSDAARKSRLKEAAT